MDEDSPYRSPQAPLAPPPRLSYESARPGVLLWFQVYCGILTFVYVATTVVLGTFSDAVLLAAICLPLAIVFGVGLFLPRERWAWIYGIVLIGIGMTSCLTLPFCVPMLIFWIKPEVKDHFDQRWERGIRD